MRIRTLAAMVLALGAAIAAGLPAHAAEARGDRNARAKKAVHEPARAQRNARPARAQKVARVAADSPDKSSRKPRMIKASLHAPARLSMGQQIGLHSVDDPLDLKSAVALVVDQGTGEVLFSKNASAVLPIASITKLMTAMVVLDAQQSLSAVLEISDADIDTEKGTRSRLRPGTRLTRNELLQLALMSSENRAANALGRHYPGGLPAFVAAMNAKARALGMADTTYVEPTGLSSSNVSSAQDLARLVRFALDYPLIRQFSTASELTVDTGYRMVSFRSTNRLIASPAWDIGLQKTGYISEAGSCLVMQVTIDNRPMVIVLLDAIGVRSRFGDAERLRHWLEGRAGRPAPMRAVQASLGS